MILVVSTLPHFLALYYSPDVYYSGVVTLSTLASIIWHYEGSDLTLFCVIDHLLATLWFFTDLYYSYNTIHINTIIILLHFVFSSTNEYTYTQSFWHLLSAIKAIYVAKYLREINNSKYAPSIYNVDQLS